MNEKPIERLNYYNGQRLEADDLKLEQEYHIRVRRWLNKSLYSAGIAHGLEVRWEKDNPHQVVVSPGLALDVDGREIILLEEKRLDVIGKPSKNGQVEGNYLTIQYREETREERSDNCVPRSKGRSKSGDRLAWGGPSRLRATPILSWSGDFPYESSGKIVLAQVELDNQCKVQQVHAYPRTYIGQAYAAAVRQYALEGERHIDKDNPGRIYFHIRGVQPKAVTLYLRAEKFSTLFYRENGEHAHTLSFTSNTTGDPILKRDILDRPEQYKHRHGLNIETADAGEHSHNISAFVQRGVITQLVKAALLLTPRLEADENGVLNQMAGISQENLNNADMVAAVVGNADNHHHSITNKHTDWEEAPFDHTHTVNTDVKVNNAGVIDPTGDDPDETKRLYSVRRGAPLTYVDNLQIYIGRIDVTGVVPDYLPESDNRTHEILEKLKLLQPTIWDQNKAKDAQGKVVMGDGSANHPLVKNGTGPIPLNLLDESLSFSEGEYLIELKVNGERNGGRILYNLYVE